MASNWPMFGFDLLNSGYQTTADGLTVAALSTMDKVSGYGAVAPCLTGGKVRGQIAVSGSYLYAPSDDGKLWKIATAGPTATWQYNPGTGKMRATPHITGGKVYGCSDTGLLFRVDDTAGTADWTQSLGCSYSSPKVSGTSVFVGSTNGNIYARKTSDGTAVWAYDTSTSAAGGCFTAIAVYNGLVFASAGSKVWAIDATAGTLTRSFPARTGSVVATAPCIQVGADSKAYLVFGSNDHFYYCYNADTGHRMWERRTSGDVNTVGVAFSDPGETVPVVILGQHNWRNGVNVAATGKQRWVRDGTASSSLLCAPATVGTSTDAVLVNVFPPNDGRVLAWQLNDSPGGHTPVWKYGTSTGNNGAANAANLFNYSSPSIANGTIYCGADDFGIYAFH